MKTARVAVLGVALAAGGAAAYLMSGSKSPDEVAALPPPPQQIATDDVLTATRDLTLGMVVAPADMQWTVWPKSAVGAGMIRKSEAPNAPTDIVGSIARGSFIQGEPIRREKLVKGNSSGFLSAILPSGMRAVSITIDSAGTSTAGGFILPNDRVDVIRTSRDAETSRSTGTDVFASETILSNVRVLAIGQNTQEPNGQPAVVGSTNATLEVDPQQAESLIQSQRIGQLSLVLRSMLDAAQASTTTAPAPDSNSNALTVVRYGVAAQANKR